MTKPSAQAVLTRERVTWFAEYYKQHPEWGIFHVSLSDGNYEFGASDNIFDDNGFPEAVLNEAAAWFNKLSPSQRRRLAMKAKDLAHSIRRSA